MRHTTTGIALAAAALATNGCGGSDEPDDAAQVRNPPAYSEQEVMDAVGLTTDDQGLTYTTASGCEVAVILTTPAEVELYAGAGDTVVTNPAGTAGVKVTGRLNPATSMMEAEPCIEELEQGLASLE